MSYILNARSMPSSPRSKSPSKKVCPYTPNSPKTRKSEIFVFPTTDFDLNPDSSLEKGGKSVANSLYNFSVGIETRLNLVLKEILEFRDCVPLEDHVFDKFVSLIDSAAACPSDCQYVLLTIPAQKILYKSLIPSKYVLKQLIYRAERLLSPDNFFVTYKSHQLIPRFHIEEMIRLFKLLLGDETPNIEDFIKDGNTFGSKFIELYAQTGVIDEQVLQDEETKLKARFPNILDFEAWQNKIRLEYEEKQKAQLAKIQQEKENREREMNERAERERIRRQREEREKELEAIENATRLRIAKQRAAKRKAAKEKAEREKAEQERLEKERLQKEKEEKEEKERREREARMIAIQKMAARKKAQLERAEREREIRLKLAKEARERREFLEREAKERKKNIKEPVLRSYRDINQIQKEQKDKAQRERDQQLQRAKEKEAKERDELHINKPYDLQRANSLQVSDIKRLLNPDEFENDGNQQFTTPRKLKGKSEGRFNLDESDSKKKRSKSLKSPNKMPSIVSDKVEDQPKPEPEVCPETDLIRKRNLELSPVDEKGTSFYEDDVILSLSPTQENEAEKEYQSKSIQKFLSEELSLKERIRIGNQLSLDLDPQEREKLNNVAKLFLSWETAYHAVKEVWLVMKKDDKFDVNVLLSMMPVTFADYTVTGLKTFANDEGISIADIENMYDRML